MDRAQPGARGSTNRNIEFGETTGQYTDGWIVPADEPTLSSQRYTSLDETTFNEFDATSVDSSLTITIDPGEAFVDGWLARDVPTDVDLAANTAGQTVVIGWDPDAVYDDGQHQTRDEADSVIISLKEDVGTTVPTVAIWEFDTDSSGIVATRDKRIIGESIEATVLNLPSVVVERPDRLPVAELDDGESNEIVVPVADGENLEVYRWGAYDVETESTPAGLDVELLDGSDTIQGSSNTFNEQDKDTPLTAHENTTGSVSLFKLRVRNTTGSSINTPGVGSHFGYVVDN